MAKLSQINRNKKREKMVAQYATKRAALKAKAEDMHVPAEERFAARLKLAKLPRNSSKTRIKHRCELSGRPRAFFRAMMQMPSWRGVSVSREISSAPANR